MMRHRTLLGLVAVALLVAAATTIDTQHVTWNPSWPARLGLGVAALLVFGAALVWRRGGVRGGER